MRKNFTLIALLAILTTIKTNITAAQANVQDSLALVDLYDSTDGAHWNTPWILSQPVNTWSNVLLDKNHRVIQAGGTDLNGHLPSSIGNLTAIKYLGLTGLDKPENLSGSIPSTIGNLKQLEYLFLDQNKLSGSIPPEIGNCTKLRFLELYNNRLTGSIPPQIDSLQNLTRLFLSNNQLTGDIPPIGNLKSVIVINLENNKLTGSIPSSIGKLTTLTTLVLPHNDLSGVIPDSLANCKSVTTIDFGYNNLTGNIPSALGTVINLRRLSLNDNSLTGNIPASFDNLLKLDSLKLQHNQLSGTQSSLKDLANLGKLSLRSNDFIFNGLEAIAQNFGDKALYYDQAIISVHQHTNTLAVTAGGTLSNNRYNWYKDGILYASNKGDSTLPVTTNGSYYVSVTNSVATQLTLYSDTLTVTGFNKPATTIALYPNPAKSNATALFNATGNYTLMLSNASGKVLQTIIGTSNKVQNKVDFNISSYPQGMYFISIKDEKETRLLKLTKE